LIVNVAIAVQLFAGILPANVVPVAVNGQVPDQLAKVDVPAAVAKQLTDVA
jgi:hypothetical protein